MICCSFRSLTDQTVTFLHKRENRAWMFGLCLSKAYYLKATSALVTENICHSEEL